MNESAGTAATATLRAGAIAAAAMLALIPAQLLVFVISPPPDSAEGWLELFARSPLAGVLAMDGLYVVNNVLLGILLLALYRVLKQHDAATALAALATGLVSIAVYLPTNKSLELWQLGAASLSADEGNRQILLAATEAQLVEYTGTAFAAYYVLGGVSILLFAVVLLRSRAWGRAAAVTALASGILMLVPSTAGAIGMIFSLLSLVPWVWFCVIAVRRLWSTGHTALA